MQDEISVIVTTFSRGDYLRRCIATLEMQTLLPDEVVIADDGSAPDQVRIIEEIIEHSPLRIIHARQEDHGFRVAAGRNTAVRRSSGNILLFTDADVVLFPDALERHWVIGAGCHWTSSYVIRLSAEESRLVTEGRIRAGCLEGCLSYFGHSPHGKFRGRAFEFRRKTLKTRLWPSEERMRKVYLLGFQASVPRWAFEKVNGFDERFEGWGPEDRDLSLRLQLAGIPGRTVAHCARAFHLWHEEASRTSSDMLSYYRRGRQGEYRCEQGLFKN